MAIKKKNQNLRLIIYKNNSYPINHKKRILKFSTY